MASAPALSSSRPARRSRARRAPRAGRGPTTRRQQRLASFGHVPADGHAARDAAPARGGVQRRGATRTIASAVPHESSTSPGAITPTPTPATTWSWPATVRTAPSAPGSAGAVAAPGVGAGEDHLGEQVAGQARPGERVGVGRAGGRGRAGRCARRARARTPAAPPRRCTIHSATLSQRAAPSGRWPRCLSLASEHSALAGRPVRALKSGRSRASACASASPRASCHAMGGCRTRARGVEQHPRLGHAGDADAGHAARRAPARSPRRGARDRGEQRVGIDLRAGGHRSQGVGAWPCATSTPSVSTTRGLAGRGADVDAEEEFGHDAGTSGGRQARATRSPSARDGPAPHGVRGRRRRGLTSRPASVPAPSMTMTTAKPAGSCAEPPPGATRWALKKGAAAAGSSSATAPSARTPRRASASRAARSTLASATSQPRPSVAPARRRSRSPPTRAGSRGRSAPAARRSARPRRSRGARRRGRRSRRRRSPRRGSARRAARRGPGRAPSARSVSSVDVLAPADGHLRAGSRAATTIHASVLPKARPRCSRAKAPSGWWWTGRRSPASSSLTSSAGLGAEARGMGGAEPPLRVGGERVADERAVRQAAEAALGLAEERRRRADPLLGRVVAADVDAAQLGDRRAAAVEVADRVGRELGGGGGHGAGSSPEPRATTAQSMVRRWGRPSSPSSRS